MTVIKSHLREHNLDEYKSVNELIHFQKNYSIERQQILSIHKLIIEHEKSGLGDEIIQLETAVITKKYETEQQLLSELQVLVDRLNNLPSAPQNVVQKVIRYLKTTNLKSKIQANRRNLDFKIEQSAKQLIDSQAAKNARYQYITSNFENAVAESGFLALRELDRKKTVIDQLNSSIYGALGEQMVVKELQKLSDDHILINNYSLLFRPPIYNKKEKGHILSIQIDHVLIAPSGVFLIETKNWSQQSLENRSMHSPVNQIKRTNFAVYKILKGDAFEPPLSLNEHHWGNRKIPIRNLIVLITHRPTEEFEHVKILTLNQLLGYVRYFKPCFSIKETQRIADYLLSLQ
ncbi:MAG TPA: nuclease-related domain-containing protein [Mucilaginibacter sp.]|nr:nuclease-related domain-containing protein [Mucilaginibacter sp.]